MSSRIILNLTILVDNNDPIISFIREIHQRLLTENKPALLADMFSKYLVSAIGEKEKRI